MREARCISTLRALALIIGLTTVHLPMNGQHCCVWAQIAIDDVRATAYPELAKTKISVRPFSSASDYMCANFDIKRCLLARRMEYFIFVNQRARISPGPAGRHSGDRCPRTGTHSLFQERHCMRFSRTFHGSWDAILCSWRRCSSSAVWETCTAAAKSAV